MTNRTRAVFFDLGGTLFSNMEILRVSTPLLPKAARRLGVEGGAKRAGLAYVHATRQANKRYVDRPFYMHRDFFFDTYRLFAKIFDREASSEFLEWFYESQREVMAENLVLREDCRETLLALRDRGLVLSLVSNIDRDFLEPMLRNLDLKALLDHWTSSEEARSCKPDPAIFHHALRKAGCREEEAMFVGDSRVHDIQGARAVGMTTVLITEEGGVSHLDDEDFDAQPDHVIAQLSELLDLVEGRDSPVEYANTSSRREST
jgi:HAD superfamily hydrolase (TIGR01509 family)